jgi:acyl-CoA thioesterase-2
MIDLARSLTLARVGEDLFRGTSPDAQAPRVFGGQVVAQGLLAAYETVERFDCHSLHSYFIHAGDPGAPILFQVDRLRDGGSFATRRVSAMQGERRLLELTASFQAAEQGFTHQAPMPAVAAGPEAIDDAGDPRGLGIGIYLRNLRNPRPGMIDEINPPQHQTWFRADGLPSEQRYHQAALAYATDFQMLPTMVQPHPLRWSTPGLQIASLDHALWFHRPLDFTAWHLHDLDSPSAHATRGLARGRVFSRTGTLVASTAQEAMFRLRAPR